MTKRGGRHFYATQAGFLSARQKLPPLDVAIPNRARSSSLCTSQAASWYYLLSLAGFANLRGTESDAHARLFEAYAGAYGYKPEMEQEHASDQCSHGIIDGPISPEAVPTRHALAKDDWWRGFQLMDDAHVAPSVFDNFEAARMPPLANITDAPISAHLDENALYHPN